MHHTTETLIIGGGVMGNSIAYHLARAGQQVLVVERAGIAEAPAASWASAGGVRRQGRDPALTTRAFAAAAQRRGATYWFRTACLRLLREGDRVVGAKTSRGEVSAGQTVLAAGAWSDTLAESIGLSLPIRTGVYQMLRSTPATPGLLRPVVGALGRQLSLKQLPDGSFLLGGGWPDDATADRTGFIMRKASVSGGWAAASAILPAVGEQQIAASWCGLEAEAFDEVPFIGPALRVERLFLAVGFSGHGSAIAPAVGEALAEELLGRPAALDSLRPSRAAGFDPEAVERFRTARV